MNRIRRLARGWTAETKSTGALWVQSILTAVVFFGVFFVALPWPFHHSLRATWWSTACTASSATR